LCLFFGFPHETCPTILIQLDLEHRILSRKQCKSWSSSSCSFLQSPVSSCLLHSILDHISKRKIPGSAAGFLICLWQKDQRYKIILSIALRLSKEVRTQSSRLTHSHSHTHTHTRTRTHAQIRTHLFQCTVIGWRHETLVI
jgi:hypothetical protein